MTRTVVEVSPGPSLPTTFTALISQPSKPSPSVMPPVAVVEIETAAELIPGPIGPQGPQGPVGPQGSPDTGADILAKLLPVDGTGSGLDADTLDGHDTPYFATQAGLDAETSARTSADALKAPLASPAFTGNPTAPTPSPGDNDTSIATTAFSAAAIAAQAATQLTKDNAQDAAINTKIGDAPSNGTQYVRQNAAWAPVSVPPGTAISDTPPASPAAGQLWWESDTGNLYIWYTDPNTSQWVQINGPTPGVLTDAPQDGAAYGRDSGLWQKVVNLAGDTMTGALVVNPASGSANYYARVTAAGNANLVLDGIDGFNSSVYGRKGLTNRWQIALGNGTAESGGASGRGGSNFSLTSYDNSGAAGQNVLIGDRTTGLLTVAADPTAPLGIATKQYVDRVGEVPMAACYLDYSGGNLVLSRLNGTLLWIQGANRTIPSGGVSLAATGLTLTGGIAAGDAYYIYAWMNGATMTLEASATAPTVDATSGMSYKTGDSSRYLVGIARLSAAATWSSSRTMVASWFNPRPKTSVTALNSPVSGNTSETELTSVLRNPFVTFANREVRAFAQTVVSNNTAAQDVYTGVGIDTAAAFQPALTRNRMNSISGDANGVRVGGSTLPSEGAHYATARGFVSGGSGTWSGCHVEVTIQG